MTETDARIVDLELKLAMTDDHVDTLNHTLFRMQQQLDLLQAQLRELHRQAQSTGNQSEAGNLNDEIPPHY